MATTFIDFENLSEYVFVTTQYANMGFIIPNGASINERPGIPSSGVKYLKGYRAEFQTEAPLVINFTKGQKRVCLKAGALSDEDIPAFGILHAFDKYERIVAVSKFISFRANNVCATKFEVNKSSSTIWKIVLYLYGWDKNGTMYDLDKIIDDLEFESEPYPVHYIDPEFLELIKKYLVHPHILNGPVPPILEELGIFITPQGVTSEPSVTPMNVVSSEISNIVRSLSAIEIASSIDNPTSRLQLQNAAIKIINNEMQNLQNKIEKKDIVRKISKSKELV